MSEYHKLVKRVFSGSPGSDLLEQWQDQMSRNPSYMIGDDAATVAYREGQKSLVREILDILDSKEE